MKTGFYIACLTSFIFKNEKPEQVIKIAESFWLLQLRLVNKNIHLN